MVMQQYSLFICHFGLSFSASFTSCLLTVFTWIVFECLNFSLFAILYFDTHIWMVASFRAAFLHLYDVGLTWHQLWSKIYVFGPFHFHLFFCCWLPFFATCKQLHLYVWISHFDFIFIVIIVKLDHQSASSSSLSWSSSWLWNWVIDGHYGHYGRAAGTRACEISNSYGDEYH